MLTDFEMSMNLIRNILVIPSYRETIALKEFLKELLSLLPLDCAVVIADDSPEEDFQIIRVQIKELRQSFRHEILFSRSERKSGRGAAVSRGFKAGLLEYPNVIYFAECDADGSHQPEDVVSVIYSELESDLLIGSRYLKSSKIINWPKSRRIFSYFLNIAIPKILDIEVSDITNGLRRYSIKAFECINNIEPINHGFIYLSEQALIVSKSELTIDEIPIRFINRIHGQSTVSYKEVINSLLGIQTLTKLKKKL